MPQFLLIEPHDRDLGGGFFVRRVLPSAPRASVGPFVFFDHFGPVVSHPGDHHDVRPHPHIGLATVTYLFEGAVMHRDSTGAVQCIEPGAINLMTAGRGIVHSERMPDELRTRDVERHGLQLWVAVPEDQEMGEPHFQHVPASRLPAHDVGGVQVRVLAGEAFGQRSAVVTASPTLFVEMKLPPGGRIVVPPAEERAIYVVDKPVTLAGQAIAPLRLAVVSGEGSPEIHAPEGAHVVVIGGQPLGKRYLFWNFVATTKERLREAADDWEQRRFPTIPGDDQEFIPLPERRMI